MAVEHRRKYDSEWAAISSISCTLGKKAKTLHKWVRQADTFQGVLPRLSGRKCEPVKEPGHGVRELRRANAMLKATTVFFGRSSTAAARAERLHRGRRARRPDRADLRRVVDPLSTDHASRPRRVVDELLRRVVLLRLPKRRGQRGSPGMWVSAPATACRALRCRRLKRLRCLAPREPAVRYCWPHADNLLRRDVRKLGRIDRVVASASPTWRRRPTSAARRRPRPMRPPWPPGPLTALRPSACERSRVAATATS